jgi:hypothetical protein
MNKFLITNEAKNTIKKEFMSPNTQNLMDRILNTNIKGAKSIVVNKFRPMNELMSMYAPDKGNLSKNMKEKDLDPKIRVYKAFINNKISEKN